MPFKNIVASTRQSAFHVLRHANTPLREKTEEEKAE